jgi:glycerol-3-phosphate acyltransferase PlsY
VTFHFTKIHKTQFVPQERSQLRLVLVVIIAYLIGSIPFGYLIVRARGGGDVRDTGSGGTGATNVSRRAGKAAGVLTLILDALKGAAAVLLTKWALNEADAGWLIGAAAIAVIVGHVFPVWLRFRGGKGVATGAGVFLVLAPMAVLCAAVIFVGVVAFTKYVSLGSIMAAATIPFFIWLFYEPTVDFKPLFTAAVAGALLIVFAHRGNISRLMGGTEPRISDLKR